MKCCYNKLIGYTRGAVILEGRLPLRGRLFIRVYGTSTIVGGEQSVYRALSDLV